MVRTSQSNVLITPIQLARMRRESAYTESASSLCRIRWLRSAQAYNLVLGTRDLSSLNQARQKFGSISCVEVQACDFALLQSLVRIQGILNLLRVPGKNPFPSQLCLGSPLLQSPDLIAHLVGRASRRFHQS